MNPIPFSPSRLLVAGCGFLGLPLARALHAAGVEVVGLVRSGDSARRLSRERFPVHPCRLTDRERLADLGSFGAVVQCAGTGGGDAEAYRETYLEGSRALREIVAPERFVFVGSTSVYAQNDGSEVTEESPAEPETETGRVLRQAENEVLAAGGFVARLGALYAVGRWRWMERFLAGEATLEGDGSRFVNRIHRDDAVTALRLLLLGSAAPGIYNVTDGHPVTRRELYASLAAHLNRPLPPDGPAREPRRRGNSNKRVSNARVRALGWEPKRITLVDALQPAEFNSP